MTPDPPPQSRRDGRPPSDGPGPYSLLFYFLSTLHPSPWRLAVIVVVILTSSAVPVALAMLPAIMARLWTSGTVEVFGHARPGAEWLWIGAQLFVVVTVAFMALQLWQQWLAATVGEGVLLELRDRLFGWLGQRSLFGDSPGSLGEVVQRMTGDAQQLRQLLFPGVLIAALDVCRVVYTVVALATLEPRVAFVLALGLALVALLSGRLHQRLIAAAARDRDVNASLSNQMIEASAGSRDLIAAGRFDRFAATFRETLLEKRRLALTTTYWGALAGSAMPLFITLAVSFYYLFSVRGCCTDAEAAVEVGRITSFAFLLGSFQQPIGQIAGFRAQVMMAAPAMLSLRSAMQQAEQIGVTPAPSRGGAGQWSELRVAQVSYTYPGAGGPALRDVSFTVPRGSFTGIVGESGSGKSTLAYVLLGTLRPDSGFAGFAGPSGMTPFAVHRDAACVGYIPQQPFIFDTSIRENILMGLRASEVTDAELGHVVVLAQLSALVSRRAGEGGLDAPCGPGGRLLSGGERQRIALARALLAKPDVIICDEYTANIDAKTALLIHHALLTEFSRQTRIVVSHQLYALRGADQLVVLQEGAVCGVGAHADLVVSCDAYRTFWDLQRLEVS